MWSNTEAVKHGRPGAKNRRLKMASGDAKYLTGRVMSTGAALDVELPFTPKVVKLINASRVQAKHFSGDDAASAFKTTAAGATTIITADGITLGDRAFTIGADADINNATPEVIRWEAYQ
jgi:hypothetical protein